MLDQAVNGWTVVTSTPPEDNVARAPLRVSRYHRFKGLVSRAAGTVLLVPCCLLILPLMAIVRASSPGPAIYRQRRVGKDGCVFTMLKLRTMRNDAEANTGPVWATEKDPRVTPVGRWLRKLHLDELPQIFNVLAGHMDLLGPRPERPEFVDNLRTQVADYDDRLMVRPGITGLAQINLPADSDVQSVRRKVVVDRYYICHASMLLDARLLACTLLYMLGVPRHRARWWFRLDAAQLGDVAAALQASDAATSTTIAPLHIVATDDSPVTTDAAIISTHPTESLPKAA